MGNLKETFMRKYGVGEYILFALGTAVLGFQVYKYFDGSFEGSMLDGVFAVCAIFALLAPLSILDWARKKAGLETRQKKLMDQEFEEKTGIDPDKPLV